MAQRILKEGTPAGTNEGKPLLVPLHKINILPQMRLGFNDDKIRELALSIDQYKILQDPGAAVLGGSGEASRYLTVYNHVKGTDRKLGSLKKVEIDGEVKRVALIYGECRIRALLLIWNEGDPKSDAVQKGAKGVYFKERFGSDLVRLNGYFGINACDALERQLSENLYQPPTPIEESVALTEMFNYQCLRHEQDSKRYSLAQFARDQGRSEDNVRTKIKWITILPLDVQELVRQGNISFAVSCELIRAFEWAQHNISNEIERYQFTNGIVEKAALSNRWSAKRFRQVVTTHIQFRQRDDEQLKLKGQYELMSIMEEAMKIANSRSMRKKEFGRSTEYYLRDLHVTIGTWTQLFKNGRLRPDHSPLLCSSVRRQIVRLAEIMEILLDHADWLLEPAVVRKVQYLATLLPRAMTDLDETYPNEAAILAAE